MIANSAGFPPRKTRLLSIFLLTDEPENTKISDRLFPARDRTSKSSLKTIVLIAKLKARSRSHFRWIERLHDFKKTSMDATQLSIRIIQQLEF